MGYIEELDLHSKYETGTKSGWSGHSLRKQPETAWLSDLQYSLTCRLEVLKMSGNSLVLAGQSSRFSPPAIGQTVVRVPPSPMVLEMLMQTLGALNQKVEALAERPAQIVEVRPVRAKEVVTELPAKAPQAKAGPPAKAPRAKWIEEACGTSLTDQPDRKRRESLPVLLLVR